MSDCNSMIGNSETKWGAPSQADSETSENDFLRLRKIKKINEQLSRYAGL